MDFSTLEEITANFVSELELSAKGQKTSLSFIKNTIPASPLVKNGKTFQVMAIGATNFFNALVTKSGHQLHIEERQHETLPLFPTKDAFLTFLAKRLKPNVRILGINMGVPLDPVFENGKLDAKLLFTVKESLFEGLVGEKICASLEEFVSEKYNRKIIASIANDTICLLLSGLTERSWDGLAAGIVGSGLNFALFLDNTTLINLEAGSFDKFPRTPEGTTIDNLSNQKGTHTFEKEIAGFYLYQHFNLLAKEKNSNRQLTSTEELSLLAEESTPDGELAREVFTKSAQFVACALSGIANFKKQDMTFVMQGSVFWKGYQYKKMVEQTVKQLAPGHAVNFIKVDHADILGAAKLVA